MGDAGGMLLAGIHRDQMLPISFQSKCMCREMESSNMGEFLNLSADRYNVWSGMTAASFYFYPILARIKIKCSVLCPGRTLAQKPMDLIM